MSQKEPVKRPRDEKPFAEDYIYDTHTSATTGEKKRPYNSDGRHRLTQQVHRESPAKRTRHRPMRQVARQSPVQQQAKPMQPDEPQLSEQQRMAQVHHMQRLQIRQEQQASHRSSSRTETVGQPQALSGQYRSFQDGTGTRGRSEALPPALLYQGGNRGFGTRPALEVRDGVLTSSATALLDTKPRKIARMRRDSKTQLKVAHAC